MRQEERFNNLKKLLLEREVEKREQLEKQLEQTRLKIQQQEERSRPQIQAMIDKEITHLKDEFPQEFGQVITETIKTRIQESKGEMVNALYPIVGRLIKKYLQKELELLAEKVDQKVNESTSWEFWKQQIINFFSGVKNSDQLLSSSHSAKIEAAFMLEADSGILLASYNRQNLIDNDMVAAMLMAIKNFVEDAFQKEKEQLEWIEYETYKIHITNLKAFNIALMISGIPNQNFKQQIHDTILQFSEEYYKSNLTTETKINELLQNYFE